MIVTDAMLSALRDVQTCAHPALAGLTEVHKPAFAPIVRAFNAMTGSQRADAVLHPVETASGPSLPDFATATANQPAAVGCVASLRAQYLNAIVTRTRKKAEVGSAGGRSFMNREFEQLDISANRWERWTEAANSMAEDGVALGSELRDAQRDPSRHRLRRCSRAARYVERTTSGERQLMANAVATEIENAIT